MFGVKRPKQHRIVFVGRCGVGLLNQYITEQDFVVYAAPRRRFNLWVLSYAIARRWWSKRGYYGAFLRLTRPELVITREDNALEFFFTKRYLPSARTLCLQNGRRASFSNNPHTTIWDVIREELPAAEAPDVILTHGAPASMYYREALAGGGTCRILAAGNLANNAFSLDTTAEEPRLLFISSFPNLGDDGDLAKCGSQLMGYWSRVALTLGQFYLAEGVIADLAAQYAEHHGLRFCVIGKRPSRQKGEYLYFEAALQNRQWSYRPAERDGASYGAVTPYDVVVNIDSTFGYEMMARGVRVAFVAARMSTAGFPEIRDCDFAYPFVTTPTGPFWTNEASRDEVFRVIDAVVSKSNSEWCTEIGMKLQDVFVYDQGNTVLCRVLDEFGVRNSGPRLLS